MNTSTTNNNVATKWILAESSSSEEEWIFLHPVDNEHRVCVQASPSEVPSLLVQPELISLEYKKQHKISRILGVRLMQHWLRIYSYLQPSFPQRIEMRRLCRLFNTVERLTTENPRRSKLMLIPIPRGVWTTFPNADHGTLEDLVEWINGVVEADSEDLASPSNAPQLLFLQDGAPDCWDDYDEDVHPQSLSGTCVVIDKTGCFRLTGRNIEYSNVVRVAQEHPNLQSLDLFGCSNIADPSVAEVGRRCSNLQTLNLRDCRITDASVSEIARGCPNLQSLNLCGCRYITDASLSEVGRRCSNLQALNLDCCSKITDASVLEVARGCLNLQLLNLEYCSNITDIGLVEVSRGCPNLQTLNLGNCEKITDASLMEVARRCSNLQTLNLEGCSRITDACKNALQQSHPLLDLRG